MKHSITLFNHLLLFQYWCTSKHVLFQTLVQVKIKLFRVEVKLAVINNSHFVELGLLNNWVLSSAVSIQLFNITNINLTTKSNYLNMEKWTNSILLDFWNDCANSIQHKCELQKRGKTNNNFDKIALNLKNHVPNTTLIQPFHSFQTFLQLKIIFLSLEILNYVNGWVNAEYASLATKYET